MGTKIGLAIIGFLLGLGALLLIGMQLLFVRAETYSHLTPPAPTDTATPIASASPWVPSPIVSPTKVDQIEPVLTEAENAFYMGDLEKARKLLTSLIGLDMSEEYYARLYANLGDLEYSQGNFRLACGYFENQYSHQKTLGALLSLAISCESSGQLVKSAGYYQELLDWQGEDADPYREGAQAALDNIREMLGSPEPNQPTP
jgi:tetratricopeptide (TPR) repeat protein